MNLRYLLRLERDKFIFLSKSTVNKCYGYLRLTSHTRCR